ncbi:uncharacterized protein MEPE_03277 [Melanopsichium pennsylvanicum]|uniref:J domain-containing protein n=2 Tax=Melanopsichium pennsylvanicum TaxID=63383 RepID=A0AAJ5C5H3_9BASI|nr:conserved hypothetical protein [Melanopsichium pennsylvanicum 4]SNX84568.1 uncharacterized protein MEPE_03277 [Melanopsichium pennsylvanicum]
MSLASSSRSTAPSTRLCLRRTTLSSASVTPCPYAHSSMPTKHVPEVYLANAVPRWLLPFSQSLHSQPSSKRHFSSSPIKFCPRESQTATSSSSGSTSASTSSAKDTAAKYKQTKSKAETSFAYPSHLKNPTPYDIFHFTKRSVTSSQIKARYYDLVRVLHPDRFSSSSSSLSQMKTKAEAEEQFKSIIAAYDLLKDGKKKAMYDRAGLGWGPNGTSSSSDMGGTSSRTDPWRGWQDMRYTRRYTPGYKGPGHDRFGWQYSDFYSNTHQYGPTASNRGAYSYYNNGWNGGNGKYTTNGVFISALFILTWVLAGLQYSRLSLQSQKAIEKADKQHLDAARSLNQARQEARSEQGKERWKAFRRRAREQKFIQDLQVEESIINSHHDPVQAILPPPTQVQGKGQGGGDNSEKNQYGIGHGGPSGKVAAQERFAKAKALSQP